jgi:EmrB/QacA subfamily drug resistance transporter
VARAERKAAAAESAKTGIMTHRQIVLVLLGLMSGMFLSALDQSVVGTAMRTIADDLQGLELQAWVTTAYLITSTVSTPIYGKLGDIFGRRRMFLVAITIFVLGSVTAGFATNMMELAAYRALQGLGAGGLFALALTILADIVPPRDRARYQGMFLAVFGTSSVIGPLVGGFFAGIDQIVFFDGWRWIFLINIPIGIAALFMVVAFLHVPHTARKSRIDWWGAVTIVLAVVPLLLVAEQGRTWGWGSALTLGLTGLGVLGIIAFIFTERAMKDDALLPLSLFKSSTFSMTTILGVIVGLGMFGGMISLPLIIQIVYGASPTEAGFLMLPMVAGLMVASIGSGQITGKTGKYKIFLIVGSAMMSLAYLYLSQVKADWEIWQVSIGMVLMGLGVGQLMQTLTIATQNAVAAKDIGVATSSATFFRQMGGTLGVAVFLSILFTEIGNKSQQMLTQITAVISKTPELLNDPRNAIFIEANAGGLADLITTDSSFLNLISPELAYPIKNAFAESASTVFLTATIAAVVAFILSFFVKELELRTKSGVQEMAEGGI